MSKSLLLIGMSVVLASVAGCGTIGKGKGKAPAAVVYEEPAAQEPVLK